MTRTLDRLEMRYEFARDRHGVANALADNEEIGGDS